MGICLYFLRGQSGLKCLRSCKNDYCYHHQNKIQLFQSIFKKHFLIEPFRINDIYLYMNKISINTLKILINYLYKYDNLLLYVPNDRYYSKQKCIAMILEIHHKLYTINKNHLKSIIILQNKFRTRNIQGPHVYQKSINDTDPFTLELINEIKSDKLFSYKNKENNIYVFSVYEFLYHLENIGMYNPLTREPISINVLYRLQHYIKRLSNEIPDFHNKWETPNEAFIDLVYKYERYGIYTSMEWFTELTFTQIVNIFILLNLYINEYNIPIFDIQELLYLLIDNQNIDLVRFALAREMKKLIDLEHDMKLYFVCNFFVVLGSVNKSILDDLPSWVILGSQLPH